ncbi:hypothetical protein HNP71_001490 [Acidocella aromatica]|uniref:Uncharacterized protein n=1 Tax=Acidocella aromatica TaxID=1303579 RepID=A0A840VNU0_9PROT|nr:hypothetical protein [Acidocella aromatica]
MFAQTDALGQPWLFWVAPLGGAIIWKLPQATDQA